MVFIGLRAFLRSRPGVVVVICCDDEGGDLCRGRRAAPHRVDALPFVDDAVAGLCCVNACLRGLKSVIDVRATERFLHRHSVSFVRVGDDCGVAHCWASFQAA